MKKAVFDLLLASLVTVSGVFIAYFYFYQRGQFTGSPQRSKEMPIKEFVIAQKLTAQTGLILGPVHELAANQLFLYFIELPEKGWENLSDEMLIQIQALPEKNKAVLSFKAYTQGIEKQISSRLKSVVDSQKIFLHSPHENVLREVHRDLPELISVVSRAEASRIYLMSQLALETLPQLEGQIFWADFMQASAELKPKLVHELQKRNVPVIFGPADSETDWEYLRSIGVNGIMTNKPNELLSWLKTRQIE